MNCGKPSCGLTIVETKKYNPELVSCLNCMSCDNMDSLKDLVGEEEFFKILDDNNPYVEGSCFRRSDIICT
jgi:hypothetical protein